MAHVMKRARSKEAAGFSLLELLIAMTITLVVMGAASKLLMTSFGTRTRENQKSDALADAQRALNIMSREIANSGFGLLDNGLVALDCHTSSTGDTRPTTIRIRANLNNTNDTITDADEDLTYTYQPANFSIVRYDKNTNQATALASRIDSFKVTYLDAANNPINIALTSAAVVNAVRVRLSVLVNLPAAPGQPASQVQLTSDVALRNAPTLIQRY